MAAELFDEHDIWTRRSRRRRWIWRRWRRRRNVAGIWRFFRGWRWCVAAVWWFFRGWSVSSCRRGFRSIKAIGREFALIQSSQQRGFAPGQPFSQTQFRCRNRDTTFHSARNPTQHWCRRGTRGWSRRWIPTIDLAFQSPSHRDRFRSWHRNPTFDSSRGWIGSWCRNWCWDRGSAREHASGPWSWQRGITASQSGRWNSGSRGKSPSNTRRPKEQPE